MHYPDLVWTVLVVIGGFLLIDQLRLTKRIKWGMGLIFAGFLFQVYWDITHPWVEEYSLLQVLFVSIYVPVALVLLVKPGWLRKRIDKDPD